MARSARRSPQENSHRVVAVIAFACEHAVRDGQSGPRRGRADDTATGIGGRIGPQFGVYPGLGAASLGGHECWVIDLQSADLVAEVRDGVGSWVPAAAQTGK